MKFLLLKTRLPAPEPTSAIVFTSMARQHSGTRDCDRCGERRQDSLATKIVPFLSDTQLPVDTLEAGCEP